MTLTAARYRIPTVHFSSRTFADSYRIVLVAVSHRAALARRRMVSNIGSATRAPSGAGRNPRLFIVAASTAHRIPLNHGSTS